MYKLNGCSSIKESNAINIIYNKSILWANVKT